MNLYNAIFNRVSTRTYIKQKLTEKEIYEIKEILSSFDNIKGPFGNVIHVTLSLNNNHDIDGEKIGTYGFIKNVPAYIGGVTQNTRESIIDFAYIFEKIILSLTSVGYSTCWLGGTFKRKQYRKELKEDEIIPAICPVGHRSDKRSIAERFLKLENLSKNRKLFNDMFMKIDESIITDKVIHKSLEAVRLGPSASNKQPWRVLVEDNMVHFYLERTGNYGKMLHYDIQLLDIGIALSHFEIALNEQVISYEIDKSKIDDKENWEYICTYILSK